jgi:hypothetical protein
MTSRTITRYRCDGCGTRSDVAHRPSIPASLPIDWQHAEIDGQACHLCNPCADALGPLLECFRCHERAVQECPRCGARHCLAHGDTLCERCIERSAALLPDRIYRGSLIVLLTGTVLVVWLLVWPQESADTAPPGALANAAPTGVPTEAFAAAAARPSSTSTPPAVATVAPSPSPALGAAAPTATPTPSPTPTATPEPTVPPPTPTPAPPVVNPNLATLSLTALQNAQIRVSVDGAVAFAGVLAAGESATWQGNSRVQVYTTNAMNLLVAVNGFELGPLSSAVGHPEWTVVDWGWQAGWRPR